MSATATPLVSAKSVRSLVVTANFTAEPLEESLRFWMDELGVGCQIGFAPYNQVFQQLLDPGSLLAGNQAGMNVALIRIEDWWQGAGNAGNENGNRHQQLERNSEDLLAALAVASKRSSVPHLVCLCPAGSEVERNRPVAEFLGRLEKQIAESAQANRGVHVVTSSELTSLYPVPQYEDLRAAEVGHVPYTQEFFNALGTMVARRFYRLQTAPHKVIVLDCDNTLWRGVCGEDGTRGVRVDPAARALQEFVIAQRQAGMVLCLCSKNNEEDVWKVFTQNSGMVLRPEHIVASRINWLPKSENLHSLAAELKLGLDSFIFLDDSAIECAEVEARCPQVLALRVPEDGAATARFLSHIWAFDHLKVTEEDRQRSQLYAQNTQRETLRKQSMNLDDFLAGLELQLDISPMRDTDLARVAQLTQRTNQFNFTTIRRSEAEIEKLCDEGGAQCLVVRLRDRFGDYGTVGAMIFNKTPSVLNVDSVLLSCRALGRRVEHQMLASLGRIAQQHGIALVRINFSPTQKNKPAREFLEATGASFETADRASYSWDVPAAQMIELPSSAPVANQAVDDTPETTAKETSQVQNKSRIFVRIATQLSDAANISRAIASRRPVKHRDDESYVAPGTPFEEFLAAAWTQFLNIDRVSAADNFFDLGGQSLSAMQIAFKIQEEFHVDFSLETFLQSPVLADQARRLEDKIIEQADSGEVERLLAEIEGTQPGGTSGSSEGA
jgi:FkbH-like protein